MAKYTKNYNLKKPDVSEYYDIETANKNNDIIDEKLYGKVDKIVGKDLSTNDFTNGYKKKLDNLENYDDTKIKQNMTEIKQEQTTQNKKIQNNADSIEALKAKHAQEISALENLIPTGQASGESIDLTDSAEYKFKKFGISGNSAQEKTTLGANYLDASKFNDSNEAITLLEDGWINVNATNEGTLTQYINVPISKPHNYLKENTNYTIMVEIRNVDASHNNSYLRATGDVSLFTSTMTITSAQILNGNKTYTAQKTTKNDFSEYTNANMLNTFVSIEAGGTANFDFRISIYDENYDGSYVAFTPNMPSSNYRSEIKNCKDNINIKICNKNLYDKNNPNILNTPIDSNGLGINDGDLYKTIYIECKSNTTYTISKKYDITKNRFSVAYTEEEPTYNMQVLGYIPNQTKSELTITTGENAKYLLAYVWIIGSTTTYQEMLDSIQIEEGSKATDYVEHEEQIITFPLEEGQVLHKDDYLTDDGIHHKRKTITLNGTENIGVYPNSGILSDMFGFYITNIEGAFSHCKILSSHFKFNSIFNSEESRVYPYAKNMLYFTIPKTIASTVDEVKTYLAEQYANNTPVVVEYELSQEEIEPYTAEQQEAYNKIKELYSYKGTTHITCEDEVSCIFQAGYYKDLETILNNMQAQILAE